jgi:branched-chain amino acid transport system ATP-binding protein
MSAAALALEGVESGYGESVVLRNVTLAIAQGSVYALLGKNGMGKTTLLNTAMGFLSKRRGRVSVLGQDVTAWPAHRIARQGVAYAAQEQALFAELSVRDNLRLGLQQDADFDERLAAVAHHFPVLAERLRQSAGTLSGGEQKMLLVARSLMQRPRLLLIDEITEGLQPSVIARLALALKAERDVNGTAILLVEQNVGFAVEVADRYGVLKRGEIVAEGSTSDAAAASVIESHFHL